MSSNGGGLSVGDGIFREKKGYLVRWREFYVVIVVKGFDVVVGCGVWSLCDYGFLLLMMMRMKGNCFMVWIFVFLV